MPYSGRKESIEAALDAPEISYGGDDRCAFSARPRHHALSLANGGGLRGHRLRWLHPDLLGSLGGGHVLGTADRARPRYPALQLDPAVLDTDDARGHRADRAAPGARTLWHRTLQRDVLCDSRHAPHPAARRFSAIALCSLPLLIGFFAAAIANARRLELHKRLMYLLMVGLMIPVLARIFLVLM